MKIEKNRRYSDISSDIFLGTDIPIVQFPYQNISSWGSSPTFFQFTVFDHPRKDHPEEHSARDDAADQWNSCHLNRDSSRDSREVISEQRELSTGTIDRNNSMRDHEEDESLSETNKSDQRSISRRSHENSRGAENHRGDIPLVLSTTQANIIEAATMSAVRSLMSDMDKSAVTKTEFEKLLSDLVHPVEKRLQV